MTSAAPPMSTTEQKAKTSSAKHIPPNEVAWMFVQEYYTFVNKNPHQLHRFYTKNSSMVHGSEAIKVEPFNGQLEIHNKILELDFQDCKVCISNVDSLASISGGIIVQVLGELSNKGGPSYKFAQTFFLAEQPGGYYVLNDIFRYLKDEVDFDYENEGEEERAAAASKEPDVAVESEETEKEPSIPSIPSSPIMAPHVTPPVVPEPEESKPDIERPASPVKAPATPEIPASSDKPETTAPAIIETPKQETNGWGNKREPSPARPAPSAPAAMQKQESARAGNAEKPKTSGAKPSPSTPSGPAPKQSWATLAANDANRWKKDNLAEVKGSVAHVSTPTNAKSSALPQSNQPPASAPTGQGMRENKEKPRQNDPNASIFVKGVVQGVTRDMLTASFSVVGEVINCDVNPSKGSAFVDFATVDSAHKAIAQGTFTTSNGSVVHAEEKRIRFYPRHPGGRGGFANRGNPNYQRGDGTDTRGGRGRGRSDMQGGGKGRAGSAASAEKAGGAK